MFCFSVQELVSLLVEHSFLHLSHENEAKFWETILLNNPKLRQEFEQLVRQKINEEEDWSEEA